VSIGTECTVSEAILFFHTQRVQALFVEESDRFVGMVIKSDLIHRINQGEMSPETTLIGERMEQPIPCLDCHSSVQEANEFMCAHHICYVAVTEDRQIIGILSLQDLKAYFGNR
jgi:predicted transcriptional regulator